MLEFQTDTVDTGVIYSLYFVINTRWVGFNTGLLSFKILVLNGGLTSVLALCAVLYKGKESAVQVLYLSIDF